MLWLGPLDPNVLRQMVQWCDGGKSTRDVDTGNGDDISFAGFKIVYFINVHEVQRIKMVMFSLFSGIVDRHQQVGHLSRPFQDTIYNMQLIGKIISCHWYIPMYNIQ